MLSKSAQIIQDFLSSQNIPAQVIELPASTRTADDAAKAIGCQPAQIVKSLIFKTKHTQKPILVLVSGPNRVNEKLIAQALNEEIVRADADFVREKTGFAIGGIPPIGHKEKLPTYIDIDLLSHTTVWAAAGTPHAVFSLPSANLQSLTEGKLLSIKL